MIKLASAAASIQSCGKVDLEFEIEGQQYEATFLRVPDLREEIVLGQKWLRQNDAVVDLPRSCLHLRTQQCQTVHWHRAMVYPTPPESPIYLVRHLEDPTRTVYEAIIALSCYALPRRCRPPSIT